MRQHLVAFFFIFSTFLLFGQDLSVLSIDTVKPHSVKKAIILSAVLPGAGQIYNHRAMPKGQKKAFWKLPLIYGSLSTSTYLLIRNQTQQKRFRQEYSNRTDGSPTDPSLGVYDNAGILTIYNQYLDWRDLSILAVAAFYFLQVADAGVEAHFVSFDISEDLSMTIQPTLLTGFTPGVGIRLNFR